ncbi:unnamed protein product [Rhizoctonia solani]|uniref:ATP-dependent DNA helicase n=1 Tax=Rhizoctonia solani TaxID=456999 RepID=A0A8H2WAJ5_9AGAM|nr:unnamed protein product [Rhizoctonia solani]
MVRYWKVNSTGRNNSAAAGNLLFRAVLLNIFTVFTGIGLGDLPLPDLLEKIRDSKSAHDCWLKTEILVIDKISMVSGKLFDLIDTIDREICENNEPFGGIKLVVSGNFFQLPPVPEKYSIHTGLELEPQFVFEANCWEATFPHTYKLT